MTTLPFKVGLALVIAAILAGAFGLGWMARGHKADADINALVAQHAKEKAERATQHAAHVEQVRKEERDTQRLIQEAQDAEAQKRMAAEAARRKSDAAARGLHYELQATRAELDALKNNPATPPGCKAAAEAGAMCAVLLGRCNDRRRELADFAESSARAGDLCVRTYDALTPPGPPGP